MSLTPLQNHLKPAEVAPERLAGSMVLTEREKIAEASRQFEAILLRQILSEAQKPIVTSTFSDNSTASTVYRDMVVNQIADSVSKSKALGLAEAFEGQLAPRAKVSTLQPPVFQTPKRP